MDTTVLNNSGDSLTAHTFSAEEMPRLLSWFYLQFLFEGQAEPNSMTEYNSAGMVAQWFACGGV